MSLVLRPAGAGDVDFVSWAILASQRSHLSRDWFDIALDRPEAAQCGKSAWQNRAKMRAWKSARIS